MESNSQIESHARWRKKLGSVALGIGRELQCPVCLSIFKDPHSLPCSHQFCHDCIQNTMKQRPHDIRCPLCKDPFTRRSVIRSSVMQNIVSHFIELETLLATSAKEKTSFDKESCDDEDYMPLCSQVTESVRTIEKPSYKLWIPPQKPQNCANSPESAKKRKSCDSDENSLPPTAEPLTEKSVSKIDDPPNSKDTAESEVRVLLSPSPTSKTAKPKKQQSSSKDSVVEKVGDESTKMNTLKFVAPFPPKVILTTSVSESDKRELRQSISKINGTIVDKLKPGVTHLVANVDQNNCVRRTLKYLEGLLQGAWILDIHWLRLSSRLGEWATEEDFEVKGDSQVMGGPKRAREARSRGDPALFVGYSFYLHGDYQPPSLRCVNTCDCIFDFSFQGLSASHHDCFSWR
eukprot:TRINITY_DN3692_c0_g1_i6.p1 TRINITY_DN3692_c0_g1~~TRINITY_DN3692_c0_g1_i6.p1  ORF type:complete len:404 (-),score=68.54 TRINITY_DN3692_c0_g1_i6:482-1693(-)